MIVRLSAALFVFLAFTLTPANADDAAERYVQIILDEAEPALAAATQEERLAGIAALVDTHVDMRRTAMFTLGQYARRITNAQKDAFLPLFREYATLVYQDALSEYSGQALVVTGSVDRSARDIIVISKVKGAEPGDRFADLVVQWRVYRNRDGVMKIVDAGAADIWLAIEQRSQFTSIIANNGGGEQGMDALLRELRNRVKNG